MPVRADMERPDMPLPLIVEEHVIAGVAALERLLRVPRAELRRDEILRPSRAPAPAAGWRREDTPRPGAGRASPADQLPAGGAPPPFLRACRPDQDVRGRLPIRNAAAPRRVRPAGERCGRRRCRAQRMLR